MASISYLLRPYLRQRSPAASQLALSTAFLLLGRSAQRTLATAATATDPTPQPQQPQSSTRNDNNDTQTPPTETTEKKDNNLPRPNENNNAPRSLPIPTFFDVPKAPPRGQPIRNDKLHKHPPLPPDQYQILSAFRSAVHYPDVKPNTAWKAFTRIKDNPQVLRYLSIQRDVLRLIDTLSSTTDHNKRSVIVMRIRTVMDTLRALGFHFIPYNYFRLIRAYGHTLTTDIASEILDTMSRERTIVNDKVMNAILQNVFDTGDVDTCMALFQRMMKEWEGRAVPDHVTMTLIIGGLSKRGYMQRAREVFEKMKDTYGVEPTDGMVKQIVAGYVQIGDLKHARWFLDRVEILGWAPLVTVHPLNALLTGYARTGKVNEAVTVFKGMERKGGSCTPDAHTYTTMMSAHVQISDLKGVLEYYHLAESKGIVPDSTMHSVLIAGYADVGKLQTARNLLDLMKEKGLPIDEKCYVALMAGYSKHRHIRGNVPDAIRLMNDFKQSGLKPTIELISHSAPLHLHQTPHAPPTLADLAHALHYIEDARAQGLTPTCATYTTLMHHWADRKGSTAGMSKIYTHLTQTANLAPTTLAYTHMMRAYADIGDVRGATQLFTDMSAAASSPDHKPHVKITSEIYKLKLLTHVRGGSLDAAVATFNDMRKAGFKTNPEVCELLIGGFKGRDRVDEAEQWFERVKRQ
ncbi:hypothetical protein HK104_002697, partial [Borealophlyctis nickersoniae]